MSHEIKTPAANRVWGLLLSDLEDEIDEADIIAIEREAAAQEREGVAILERLVIRWDDGPYQRYDRALGPIVTEARMYLRRRAILAEPSDE